MRGKRSKTYRKLMNTYSLTFGFRPPYQVLLSSTLIRTAAATKMNLGHMLSNTLHDEIKPMITQCCIRHLYDAKAETGEEKAHKEKWIEVAKAAERRRCGHHELETPLDEGECLASVVDPKGSGTNKNRYVVATQDVDVRRQMRAVAGVPLVYINRSVMILEPMAGVSSEVREADERGKIRAGLKGRRGRGDAEAEVAGEKRKREDVDDGEDGRGPATQAGAEEAQDERPKKKKPKGPKGPNPLSMKKSSKDKANPNAKSADGKKKATTKAPTVGKEVEAERAAVRKATKGDPQAAEKAVKPETAVLGGGALEAADAGARRKRKRKHKDAGEDGGAAAGVEDEG